MMFRPQQYALLASTTPVHLAAVMSKKEKKESNKKDKRHKEKRKKSKKSSDKRGDGEKTRRQTSNNRNEISDLLSVGMVIHPKLMNDFSDILMALDSGKQFQLLDNGDVFNTFLLRIFRALPVKELDNVWTKIERTTNLRKCVLENLLSSGFIMQPNAVSTPESLAGRAAHTLQPLLSKFPSLWSDISPLLDNFIAGEAVDVSGIEIKAIKKGLCSFFEAIGAESNGADDENGNHMTFVLPSKSHGNGKVRTCVVVCCCVVLQSLTNLEVTVLCAVLTHTYFFRADSKRC